MQTKINLNLLIHGENIKNSLFNTNYKKYMKLSSIITRVHETNIYIKPNKQKGKSKSYSKLTIEESQITPIKCAKTLS